MVLYVVLRDVTLMPQYANKFLTFFVENSQHFKTLLAKNSPTQQIYTSFSEFSRVFQIKTKLCLKTTRMARQLVKSG